jgi:hypothetical protein
VAGFGMNISSVGTGGSGEFFISGLPFTSATNGSYREPTASLQGGNWNTAALAGQVYGFAQDNSTNIGVRYQNNSDTAVQYSELKGGNAAAGTYIGAVLIYYTS